MSTELKHIAIIGAGGLGKEIVVLIEHINRSFPAWKLIGFFDDALPKGSTLLSLPVLGGINELNQYDTLHVVMAIGNPAVKESIVQRITNAKLIFPTLIHPQAVLGKNITIGEGSLITAGCVLTVDIQLGKHVLVNLNSTIGHDVTVGDFGSIMPGAHISGFVTMGKSVFIGTGASVLQHVTLGEQSIIGAGAVVIHAVADKTTVVGVPARIIKS